LIRHDNDKNEVFLIEPKYGVIPPNSSVIVTIYFDALAIGKLCLCKFMCVCMVTSLVFIYMYIYIYIYIQIYVNTVIISLTINSNAFAPGCYSLDRYIYVDMINVCVYVPICINT
jgi:hypothetical protein